MRDYWRPIAMFEAQGFEAAPESIAPLAGLTYCGFSHLERISRDEAGRVRREVLLLETARKAGFDETVEARFCQPRAAIAGLDMGRPQIMGIVNVTPDSFFDGGQHEQTQAAVAHGLALYKAGAAILDIGGESTRPGAEIVPFEAELARVVPVIRELKAQTSAVISIDTRKAAVMQAAVEAGADIINDVSALTFDSEAAAAVAAKLDVPVILMHAQGTPETMQDDPHYDDVLLDVYEGLHARMEAALAAGISREKLIVDPGIGFGKTTAHNAAIMAGLSLFHGLGVPVLLGCSRKRFIAALSDNAPVEARLPGSLAGALQGVSQGVQILRVHDVAETRQALDVLYGGFLPAL